MFVNYTILLAAAVLAVVAWVVRRVYVFVTLPSAPGAPLAAWSNTWQIFKIWQGRFEIWNIEQHAAQGKVLRVAPHMYSIDDPEAAKQIYGISAQLQKAAWYDAWGDPRVKDHNVFSARNRRVHSEMRRHLANLYSMSSIRSYEPYVDQCIDLLFENFDRIATSGQRLDLQHWLQCYAFDVIGAITFGKTIGFLESGGEDVSGIMKGIEHGVSFATFTGHSIWLLPILIPFLGNPITPLDNFVARLRARAKTPSNDKHAQTFEEKCEIIEKNSPILYKDLRLGGAMMGNIAAGSDTTSIALTATLFHIFRDRNIYLKLRNEILSATKEGQWTGHITFEQAQKLPYFQLVLKEGMRIHPSVGLPVWRDVPESGLNVAGTFFPPGSVVGINPWVAHYNKDVFGQDADQFRPERWDASQTSAEQLAQMEQYFMPFGQGSRTCLGRHISVLEMTKLIPEIIRRYDITLLTDKQKSSNRWFVKQKDQWATLSRFETAHVS